MEARKKEMRRRGEAGFTLVEVIVIVAVLAIVAGIVAPMIFKQIDESKVTRAEADCKSIGSAVLTFRKDVGIWPNLVNQGAGCVPGISLLKGSGQFPQKLTDQGYDTEAALNLTDVVGTDSQNCYNVDKFKGPYLPRIESDPWGNAYVINAGNFPVDGQPVFVVSAGPDGIIDTAVDAQSASGDDILSRIK